MSNVSLTTVRNCIHMLEENKAELFKDVELPSEPFHFRSVVYVRLLLVRCLCIDTAPSLRSVITNRIGGTQQRLANRISEGSRQRGESVTKRQ